MWKNTKYLVSGGFDGNLEIFKCFTTQNHAGYTSTKFLLS